MTLSLWSRSLIPSPLARTKMPQTRLSSKPPPPKRGIAASESSSKPGSESPDGVSGPEIRVFVRRKRVKKAVEVLEDELKAEPLRQRICGLPDIEDFAYGKSKSSSQFKMSIAAADVPSVKLKVVPSTKPKCI